MYLLKAQFENLRPLGAGLLDLSGDDGLPRRMTCILGPGGSGKTHLVSALAQTRPGHCATQWLRGIQPAPFAECSWFLGIDDPLRPHPLRVISPNTPPEWAATRGDEMLRRREQQHFDRLTKISGFVFCSFNSSRWFARQPLSLNAPGRTLSRHEIRASATADDTTRGEIARETKQILAYAELSSRLPSLGPNPHHCRKLAEALRHAVETVLEPERLHFVGLEPTSFEPMFRNLDGGLLPFDALSTAQRSRLALVASPVRTLWAAYPERPSHETEGVVVVDDIELHQPPELHALLPDMLRRAVPTAQWILSTASNWVTANCAEHEIVPLDEMSVGEFQISRGSFSSIH